MAGDHLLHRVLGRRREAAGMSAAKRRIQLLKQRFATPAQGFAYNSLPWGKAWMPAWEDLDRAIEKVAEMEEAPR